MMLRISEFRTGLTKVATYGHIPVPLVYTQVIETTCEYLSLSKDPKRLSMSTWQSIKLN